MSKRGKKDCPNCSAEVGARCILCSSCGFDFVAARKEKIEAAKKEKEEKKSAPVKERYIDPRVKELYSLGSYVTPDQASPQDHAERILSYGVARAKNLLALALNNKYWHHVDWDVVKKGLS